MSANVEAMVREGIRAYRAGNKLEAQSLLMKATELDQYNEDAWLWLSSVVDTDEEKRTCLENVLVINPDNKAAQQGMALLDQNKSMPPPGAGDDPFSTATFDDNPIPSSSASAAFAGGEPSEEDYDDWVAGLNLGGDEDDAAAAAPAAPDATGDPFGGAAGADPFGGGAFSGSNFFGDEADAPFSSTTFDVPEDEPSVTVGQPPTNVMSPGMELSPEDGNYGSPQQQDLDPAFSTDTGIRPKDQLGLVDDVAFADEEDDDYNNQIFADDDYDDVDYSVDAEDYLSYIPDDIKATRLPGTNEKYPSAVIAGITTMVILNVLAVIGLIVQVVI